MGARGPAPTPTEILKLRGSWRAGKNKGEPQPDKGPPKCPGGLSDPEKVIWRSLVKMLDAMGVLSRVDGWQLERYATYFVMWRECKDFLRKNGSTYPLKSDDPSCYVGKLPDGSAVVGFVEYPQLKEMHRLDHSLKQIEANFGLTPSSRSRITIDRDEEPQDELDAYKLA
jgi:P27 family predicted phage terminase small subunit